MTVAHKISLPPEAITALNAKGVTTDEPRGPTHPAIQQVCREHVAQRTRVGTMIPTLRNRALMFSSHSTIIALERGRRWREEYLDEGNRN